MSFCAGRQRRLRHLDRGPEPAQTATIAAATSAKSTDATPHRPAPPSNSASFIVRAGSGCQARSGPSSLRAMTHAYSDRIGRAKSCGCHLGLPVTLAALIPSRWARWTSSERSITAAVLPVGEHAVMLTDSGPHVEETGRQGPTHPRGTMRFLSMRVVVATLGVRYRLRATAPRLRPERRSKACREAGRAAGRRQGKEDRRIRRSRASVLGGPAANPECVWLGRRVVSLLWRDDLDTAFRHLDLYDRFGCPGRPHPGDVPLRRSPGARSTRRPPTGLQPRPFAAGSIRSAEAQGTAAATGGTTNR